jgi:hypothetical protein
MQIKTSKKDKILYLCTLYICVWAISPPLAYGTIYRILALIAVSIFILSTIKQVFRHDKHTVFLLFTYLIYTFFITSAFDTFSFTFTRKIQLIIFFFFLYIFLYYKQVGFKQIYSLFFIVLLLFGIWNCITVVNLATDPYISRYLVQSLKDSEQYTDIGIGGYGLVYAVMPIISIIFYLIYKRAFHKMMMILSLFFAISGIILVLNAGYSIALILLCISFVTTFGLKKKKIFDVVAFVALVFIGLTIFMVNEDSIFSFLSNTFASTPFEIKINDIHDSFTYKSSVGTAEGRTERYLRDISIFLNNPLIGDISFLKIGKHSAILDNFAQYGLFIGLLFLHLLLLIPRKYCKMQKEDFGCVFSMFVTVLLLSLFNNIPASLGVTLYLLFPIALDMLNTYKQ